VVRAAFKKDVLEGRKTQIILMNYVACVIILLSLSQQGLTGMGLVGFTWTALPGKAIQWGDLTRQLVRGFLLQCGKWENVTLSATLDICL
jgi:hypothetical protein